MPLRWQRFSGCRCRSAILLARGFYAVRTVAHVSAATEHTTLPSLEHARRLDGWFGHGPLTNGCPCMARQSSVEDKHSGLEECRQISSCRFRPMAVAA